MREQTGHGVTDICYAYMAARAVFNTPDLYLSVDALDNTIGGHAQLTLYARIQDLIRQATGWFLRNMSFEDGLSDVVYSYRDGIAAIQSALMELLTEEQRAILESDRDQIIASGPDEGRGLLAEIFGWRFEHDDETGESVLRPAMSQVV